MGPVIFITGNEPADADAAAMAVASMGPVIFITGNRAAVSEPGQRIELQWGR